MPARRDRLHRPGLPSKPQAPAALDDHDFPMSVAFHGTPSIGILSPTPRALAFPQYPVLDLDGPTPRAFAFPASVHDALLPPGPPLTPPEPEPSTPSTSSSPFEPDPDAQSANQRPRTAAASPAAQLRAFNAPDPDPAPATLAHRRRGSSISSLALPPNPHAHAITLGAPERRPKRGDEDYIKRPENAFILFRRECCLKKNQAEAVAASEGDAVARRQRQADLSKTISQQWRSLPAAERKYWDDLAKQRKKEHEEMYPWYVYQPTRSRDKKSRPAASSSTAGGKAKKDGKKTRDKSGSRVRGANGARARGSSSCSTASTASSSASTIDSEDLPDFDSADGGYASEQRVSYRDLEMADVDFEMTDSDASSAASQQQQPQLSLPMSLMMSPLGNGSSLTIDTRNPLASFSLESGPLGHHHGHGHGHGHGHSLSAQLSAQTVQNLGPLSYVLPQGRRSTSAPGAPTPPSMPHDLYPPMIKLPTLLSTASSTVSSPSPIDQSQSPGEDAQQQQQQDAPPPDPLAASEGMGRGFVGFQFPTGAMHTMSFDGLSGQAPDYSAAGGEMHNAMFHVYEQQQQQGAPDTAKPTRARALSQIAIPPSPSTGGGPLSAPTTSSAGQRLYLPSQPDAGTHLHVPARAVPLGLPESPRRAHDWDAFELPAWAMPTLYGGGSGSLGQEQASPGQQGQGGYASLMGADGCGEMGMDMSAFEYHVPGMEQFVMQFHFEDLLDPSQL